MVFWRRQRISRGRWPWLAAGLIAVMLLTSCVDGGAVRADDSAPCLRQCTALPSGVTVDPASYKLWPSGARTLLDTSWTPSKSVGVFALLNAAHAPSPAFRLSVLVENHDPITEAVLSSTGFAYDVPSLEPGQSVRIGVPLDYSQCDIYLTVAPGTAAPDVLRTGDPAAC